MSYDIASDVKFKLVEVTHILFIIIDGYQTKIYCFCANQENRIICSRYYSNLYNYQFKKLSEFKKLALLPTYDEAIAMLMSVIQAPLQKLMATMNAVPTKIVRTLDAIKQSKD